MVARGYKDTEIGVIPVEWEVVKLKDIGQAIIGLTYSPKDVVDYNKDAHLVLRSSNVQKSNILLEDNVYVNKEISEKLIVKDGDILICSRNGSKNLIGKNAYISKEYEGHTFGAFMTIYRSKYSKFVHQLFQTDLYKKQINSNMGATINQITTGNLNAFKFPLPPLKEQEKIADILSTADEKIDAIEGQIQKAETLKKGLLQKLLSEGINHCEFKDSELGKIPESWEVVKLEYLINIISGQSPSKFDLTGTKYKFFKVNQLNFCEKYLTNSEYAFDEEIGNLLDTGTVIFPKRGASIFTNKVRILTHKSFIDTNLMGLIAKDTLNNMFLYYWLVEFELSNIADTSSVPQINNKHINPLKIPLPPLKEQKQIADILSTADEKLEVLRAKKQMYETLKIGLLQKLLSGEIRTV